MVGDIKGFANSGISREISGVGQGIAERYIGYNDSNSA
jgi:hypothetical protein